MISPHSVALALADTMLAGEGSVAGLIASAAWSFEADYAWVPALCAALHARTDGNVHHFSRDALAGFILENDDFYRATRPRNTPPQIRRYCLALPRQIEQPAWLTALALPALATVGDLADWLGIGVGEAGWFADRFRLDAATPACMQHYHVRWVPKRSGGWRLIEIPKQRLRALQRQILRQILDLVPPHPAAHGFRRGHSCLTHAALHTGKRVVIRMDLKDFFPSIPASRVEALFIKLGYSASVAGVLARLCVNRTPVSAFRGIDTTWAERQALRTPHLPQGSPCSPALANACAFRLDIRLHALAQSMGAAYSRYADDLVFSSDTALAGDPERFHVRVAAIALEEGFRVNARKTRLMRAGVRQQVTGIVVNSRPNIARDEFDRLKATLTNCVRHGPASQNREQRDNFRAWLGGKVAHVRMLNPAKGERLLRLYRAIAWPAGAG